MHGSILESRYISNNFRRYFFAVALFVIVIGVSALLSTIHLKINLTLLVVAALFLASWYAGRWPAVLFAALIELTTIISNPVPPDSTMAQVAFGHFSVFSLFIFIIWILSSRKVVEMQLRQQGEQLQHLNETLELRVNERTSELVAANKELESFSYAVSHDLRAPLRAIDGFSCALLEDYNDKLDAGGRNFLGQVRSASKNMSELIDDLLKLSSVTRSEITRANVDLSEIARGIKDKLQKDEPDRNVEFAIADDMVAYCDERLLGVVLQNLLGNAWKFTAKNPSARITFGTSPNGARTEYVVSDNGAGFDMAYADKLFGAFQRLHSVSEFEGTGIGLATVQRVVNRHGGSIRAEGVVGEGARFYFTL